MNGTFLKRPFDILLSGIGLIISSWLWVLIAFAIIFEDGFPVFIRQKRIGKGGRFFRSYKFRSMSKSTLNEKINVQACENDHRVTGVGRVLRMTAFDELPQLLNIFLGDMSFVGPRALLPVEREVNGNDEEDIHIRNVPGYDERIKVCPGLTGIAQVYAPRDLPRKDKFKYDLFYIRKMNFLLDIKLIYLSFLVTFKGQWENRDKKLEILEKIRV